MNPTRLHVENLGQIANANVTFGDLTVLVGPQATGKSIFLQTLKLLVIGFARVGGFEVKAGVSIFAARSPAVLTLRPPDPRGKPIPSGSPG